MSKYAVKRVISSEVCLKEKGWANSFKSLNRRYYNTDQNWQENFETKSKRELNADYLYYCRAGNKRIVKYALAYGADMNVLDADGNNGFLLALESSSKQLIDYLFEVGNERGLNFNALNKKMQSALHISVRKNNFRAVRKIKESGGDINIKGLYKQSPIFEVVVKKEIREEDVEMLDLLHDLGADINSRNREMKTPLMECSHSIHRYRGLTKIIELAKEDKILDEVINAQDNKGNTAFYYAINACNGKACGFLYKNGIDLNIKNDKGVTYLMLAAKRGYKQALRALLATNKVNVFAVDNSGKTALDYAKISNNRDSIDILTKAEKYMTRQSQINFELVEAKLKGDFSKINDLNQESSNHTYGDLSFFGKQNRKDNSFQR